MARNRHIAGKRISRSHTTAIPLAQEVAKVLNYIGNVTKISLGVINARASCRLAKLVITRDQYTLRLLVQNPPRIQELYVSASDREQVIWFLEAWCRKRRLVYTTR